MIHYSGMKTVLHIFRTLLLLACLRLPATAGKVPDDFTGKFAEVNGVRIHYSIGGTGSAVVLLHGYARDQPHVGARSCRSWRSGTRSSCRTCAVQGIPAHPESGYDKKTMAQDIHALVTSLGTWSSAGIVGHDIGLMVAYAYAAQYPAATERSC